MIQFYNFRGNVPVEVGYQRGSMRFLWSRVIGVCFGSIFIGIVRGQPARTDRET